MAAQYCRNLITPTFYRDARYPLGAANGRSPTEPRRNIEKLAIAVTFHYDESRFAYLSQTTSQFGLLANKVDVAVVTNVSDEERQDNIRRAISHDSFSLQVISPAFLEHPYLLTWSHFDLFRRLFREDQSITHFMYLEDDIRVNPENIAYWLRGRESLRQFGLIPSFLRYELKKHDNRPYSTDVTRNVKLVRLPRVRVTDTYFYVNLPQPYQGMYLLDRELMNEHIVKPSSSPEFGSWGIREKAAQGLTFANVPKGCLSRNFVGYDMEQAHIDSKCLIHHTPNNYADNPNTRHGKILVSELIS